MIVDSFTFFFGPFMSDPRFSWQSAVARALIGALGGWLAMVVCTAGLSSLLAAGNGGARADAAVATGMLAFLVWPAALLVAFACARVTGAALWVGGASVCGALILAGLRWSGAA
jgi:hypothetical protein